MQLEDNSVYGGIVGAENSDSDSDDIVAGPQFVQVGIPSRKRLREAFPDPPQKRSKCFGCIYEDGAKTGELPKRRIDGLMAKLVNCIGQMDEEALFKEVAADYEHIRNEVNARLQPGQRRLPRWKASTIADHMYNHHDDPQFHLWQMIRTNREVVDIARDASIRQDQQTGHKSVDKDQFKCYMDAGKFQLQLMMKDISGFQCSSSW